MNVNYDPEELNIATNLIIYIRNKELLQRKLSSIDRIIKVYFDQKNRSIFEEKQIVDFLFQLLDKYGKSASIVFKHIKNCSEINNIIKRLHENYKDKFDFNVISDLVFQNSIELIKNQEKMKKYIYFTLYVFSFLVIVFSIFCYRNDKIKNQIYKTMESYENNFIHNEMASQNKYQFKKTLAKQFLKNKLFSNKQKLDNDNQMNQQIEYDISKDQSRLSSIRNTNKILEMKFLIIQCFLIIIDFFIITYIFISISRITSDDSFLLIFSFICNIFMSFLIPISYSNVINTIYSILFITSVIYGYNIFLNCQSIEYKVMSLYLHASCLFKYFMFLENEDTFKMLLFVFAINAIEMIVFRLIDDDDDQLLIVLCGEIVLFLFDINGKNSPLVLSNAIFITFMILLAIQCFSNGFDDKKRNVSIFLLILALYQYSLFVLKKYDLQCLMFISAMSIVELVFLALFNSRYNDNNVFIIEVIMLLFSLYLNYFGLIIITIKSMFIVLFSFYYVLNNRNDYQNKISMVIIIFTTIVKYGICISKNCINE